MRKFINLLLVVDSLTVDGQSLLRVRVAKGVLTDWCLCLQLPQDSLGPLPFFGDLIRPKNYVGNCYRESKLCKREHKS